MSKYHTFIFQDYAFEPSTGVLTLRYNFDDTLHFTETYRFAFDFVDYNPAVLDRAMASLFFMAGVSYYKRYLPPVIDIRAGQLDASMAEFFAKTYQRGLGEFWYVNKLDPTTPIPFAATTVTPLEPVEQANSGFLVAVGGGKDSLVTVELLRRQNADITTWSLGHKAQLAPLVERMGTQHLSVEREWDPKLLALKNDPDAYSGHVPISAIFACVGTVVAVLSGKQDVVLSNEQSANEPTLHYQGVAVNHQYSKSQEFERDYQRYLHHTLGDSVRYYSLLRSLSEVHIADIFARISFDTYKDVFSSCNRAFTHDSDHMFWCGHCPKCAFVFLALTPFIAREELERVWHGKNLLLDADLQPLYRRLLGIEGDKPLDCVGEVKESRAAMRLALATHPELADVYQFDIPDDYDYKTIWDNELPDDVKPLFEIT